MARDWSKTASKKLLEYVWKGCDSLASEQLANIPRAEADNYSHIERSLTQALVPEINRAMPHESPFCVQQEVYEFETAVSSQAQPPQYDIAFILYQNQRIVWPIEAKVLPTDGTLSEYVNEVRDNFLTCRYAPFSTEGAILAYLLTGKPAILFRNIEKRLTCVLSDHPDFRDRDHRTSDHQRPVPKDKNYAVNFRCHHLVLEVGAGLSQIGGKP
jgi:hypothetical protein